SIRKSWSMTRGRAWPSERCRTSASTCSAEARSSRATWSSDRWAAWRKRPQSTLAGSTGWGRYRQAAHLSLDQVARDDRASALQVLTEVRHRSDGHALPRVIDQLLRID